MYSSLSVASDSKLYAAYYDSTNEDLKFAKSVDGGVNWLADDIRTIDSGTTAGKGIRITSYNVCYTKLLRKSDHP